MFKKIPLINKIKKISPDRTEPDQPGDSQPAETADFGVQKELDKKLVYSLNKRKIPRWNQIKYLFHVLNPKQHQLVGGLMVLIVACLIIISGNFYFRNFLPTPAFGGEYIEGLIGAPQYINPILSQTNDVDSDISRLVFSGLLKYDQEFQPVPELAESWQKSEDQKIYTFTLKDGIKWHDGEPLTADDVVFTFQSIKDPDFKSPLLISFRGVEIEKVNQRTIRFILPESYPAFLEVLTVGILPEHIWGDVPPINANLNEYNLKPVGSGPWEFKSLAKDGKGNIKSYVLVPNPDYYGPKPYLEKITFKFYPDFQTAISALKNHSTEGISFLPKELKSQLTGIKSIKYYSFYLPQYTAVFFNQKQNEILKEKSVRQALALSIDKPKILTEALRLEGEIIEGPILPLDASQITDKQIVFDAERANQILTDAGWSQITRQEYEDFISQQKKESQEDEETEEDQPEGTPTPDIAEEQPQENQEPVQNFYRKKNDTILEVTLTTVNQPENTKAAELIKEFWEDIGVKVNLQIVEGGRISREIIKPRNYQILLFGIIVGSNPDPYPFWHSSQAQDPGLNLALLANREVDKLLEDAKKTTDPEKQRENYQLFYDILADEIPAIFLYNPTYTYVADQKIKGLKLDRIIVPADRFNNLDEWYIKTKRKYHGNTETNNNL